MLGQRIKPRYQVVQGFTLGRVIFRHGDRVEFTYVGGNPIIENLDTFKSVEIPRELKDFYQRVYLRTVEAAE